MKRIMLLHTAYPSLWGRGEGTRSGKKNDHAGYSHCCFIWWQMWRSPFHQCQACVHCQSSTVTTAWIKTTSAYINNYLKWKVTKLCGILRYSRTYYKQHTWLNDTWKNIPRKMMQSSNIARDGRDIEDHQEKAPCGTLFCINSCICNMDQVSYSCSHSAPVFARQNHVGIF